MTRIAASTMTPLIALAALALGAPGWAAQTEYQGVVVKDAGGAITAVGNAADETACTRAGKQIVLRGGQKFCGAPLNAAAQAQCTQAGGKIVKLSGKPFCEKAPAPAAPPPAKGQ